MNEAQLSMHRRFGTPENVILVVQGNLAITYCKLGRREEALRIYREVYAARLTLSGPRHHATLLAASNLSDQLVGSYLWDEAKQFLSEQIPIFQDVNGPDEEESLKMRWRYALVLQREENYTEAVAILEDVARRYRRVFGNSHPMTARAQGALAHSRERLSS